MSEHRTEESKMSECGDKCLCGKKTELDPNVQSVMTKHKTRAEVGMDKYGVDTTRTDVDLRGWLNHLQEELMDATLYLQKLKESTTEELQEALLKSIEVYDQETI